MYSIVYLENNMVDTQVNHIENWSTDQKWKSYTNGKSEKVTKDKQPRNCFLPQWCYWFKHILLKNLFLSWQQAAARI